jgi:hypothetical protein
LTGILDTSGLILKQSRTSYSHDNTLTSSQISEEEPDESNQQINDGKN